MLFPLSLPSLLPVVVLQRFYTWHVVLGTGKLSFFLPFLLTFLWPQGNHLTHLFPTHKKRGRMFSLSRPPAQRSNLSWLPLTMFITVDLVCVSSEVTEHHHGHNTGEQLTDGGSNARLQAVQRRSLSFEVVRRKVVFSTHLNPTSIWLWGRTAKKEEDSCQLTGITGAKPGSTGNLHFWRFSWSVIVFLCADCRFALALTDFSPQLHSVPHPPTVSSQPALQCSSSSLTSCPFPTPWQGEHFCGCFCLCCCLLFLVPVSVSSSCEPWA